MAPTNNKAVDVARRKSSSATKPGQQPTLIVNLKVKAVDLRRLLLTSTVKEDSSASTQEAQEAAASPESSAPTGQSANANGENANGENANGETASDSNVATPQAEGTPVPSTMGPPSDGGKKKGVKRAAPNGNGGSDNPKARSKPGPKKKQKLEDGTGEPIASRAGGGHKLGPKANQGAINAGLRALDRSGKPCRKWARGNFQLKSFTGTMWEICRWTAPPKKAPESSNDDSGAPSADNTSSKENKENGDNAPDANSAGNSNSGADVDARSAPSNHASPAPIAVAAAS